MSTRRRVAIALAAALAGLSGTGTAAARPGFSLTVSPSRLVVTPGARAKTKTFRVWNGGTKRLHVDVSPTDFVQLEGGQLGFGRKGRYAASTWVQTTPRSFDLAPRTSRRVRVTIDVPPSPEPGEHQVGLIFRVPAPHERGLRVSGAIGSVLLVKVPGAVKQHIDPESLDGPFIADGPVHLKLRVHNLGNVHRDYIHPHELFAHVNGERVRFPSFTVLRNSTREVTAEWNDPPRFCICTARLTTDDGRGNLVTVRARVIVFPYHLVAGLLLATFGAIILVRRLRRRSRERIQALQARLAGFERREAQVFAHEPALAQAPPAPEPPPTPAPPAPPLREEPASEPTAAPEPAVDLEFLETTPTIRKLERLLEESHGADDVRLQEWQYYLRYLREHADPSGRLPRSFDSLVDEVFGELLDEREPALS